MKTGITRSELEHIIDSGLDVGIIDVRSLEEYREKHIPVADHVPIETIESGAYIPEPGKIIVTVCGKGGGRSERAAKCLKDQGVEEVYFLSGGTYGWFEHEKNV